MQLKPGTKVGKFTLISDELRTDLRGKGVRYWLCQCECGTKKYVRASNITAGTSRSCGCQKGGPLKGAFSKRSR